MASERRQLRYLLTLAALTLACGGLLAGVAALTKAPIADARTKALRDRLSTLASVSQLPAGLTEAAWPLALCDGITLLRTTGRGYGGPIDLALALKATAAPAQAVPAQAEQDASAGTAPAQWTVERAVVLNHRETPGIGDFIAEQSETRWLDRFLNQSAAQLRNRPYALDAVTGATVTVRAVRQGILTAMTPERLAALPRNLAPCTDGGP